MSKNRVLSTVVLLAPFVFSFAFAMDIYIPAVPAMKQALHTSQTNIQLTLSLFMFGTGMGQLLMGAAADQYGRRCLILWSVAFFILGSVMCAIAMSIQVLMIARLIQSFGGCGMLVTAFAIVRDEFSGKEAAKVYSFLNCGIAMSPLFAPIIGSYLFQWFNWRAGFIFLTIMTIIIWIMAFYKIKETLPVEKRVKIDLRILQRYWWILKNPTFMAYLSCTTAGLVMFFVFFSSSPYIIINLLHTPIKDFGYYFFIIGSMFFIGSLICGKFAGQIGVLTTVFIGICILLAAGIIMLIWYSVSGLGMVQYIAPCMLAGIGGSFMMGAGAGGAMEPFGEIAGSAAALLGCIEFLCAAVLGTVVMNSSVNSTVPLSLTMIATSAFALLFMMIYYFSSSR